MTTMALPALVQKFFTDRLYTQMEASTHTIASYRDTFRLLLKFSGEKTGKTPTALSVDDLDVEMIGVFLDDIENIRKKTVPGAGIHGLQRSDLSSGLLPFMNRLICCIARKY